MKRRQRPLSGRALRRGDAVQVRAVSAQSHRRRRPKTAQTATRTDRFSEFVSCDGGERSLRPPTRAVLVEEERRAVRELQRQADLRRRASVDYRPEIDPLLARAQLKGTLESRSATHRVFRRVRDECRRRYGLTHAGLRFVDRAHPDVVSHRECREGLAKIGVSLAPIEEKVLLCVLDPHGTGRISFRRLVRLVTAAKSQRSFTTAVDDDVEEVDTGVEEAEEEEEEDCGSGGDSAVRRSRQRPKTASAHLFAVDNEQGPVAEGARPWLEERERERGGKHHRPRDKKQQHLASSSYLFKPLPGSRLWRDAQAERFDNSEASLLGMVRNDGAVRAKRRSAKREKIGERRKREKELVDRQLDAWEAGEQRARARDRLRQEWLDQVKGPEHDLGFTMLSDFARKFKTYRYKKTPNNVAMPQF